LKTAEHHDHVQSLIRLLAESGEGTEVSSPNDPWLR